MRRAWTLILFALALLAVGAAAASSGTEPFRILANIYSVGASDATVFLIGTPKGIVLLDTGAPGEYEKIRANIAKLGFDYYGIRIIILSQADREHAGNLAQIRRETGARLMVSEADVPLLAAGGPFARVDVDQQLREGDRVTIGGLLFTAHIAPGDTKGCTTWTTQVRWERKPYDVVFAGCHPQNAAPLKSIKSDIFLGARGSYFGLEKKYARRHEKSNPFIDPDAFRKFIDEAPRH
ncbi:MAG TPA: MBL fold metallo-hydrolase [Thermoanaerobaculia bacterium]|nr:MBL fold metallo-hydrolase [Thermoanaerobaculia bacterium]